MYFLELMFYLARTSQQGLERGDIEVHGFTSVLFMGLPLAINLASLAEPRLAGSSLHGLVDHAVFRRMNWLVIGTMILTAAATYARFQLRKMTIERRFSKVPPIDSGDRRFWLFVVVMTYFFGFGFLNVAGVETAIVAQVSITVLLGILARQVVERRFGVPAD